MWSAKWIWLDGKDDPGVCKGLFKRSFTLARKGFLRIHVSADSRYRLYLDGRLLGDGPALGDLWHYHYESYGRENPESMEKGEHLLSAEVISHGRYGPACEVHYRGGFIVEGGVYDEKGNKVVPLETPGEWEAAEDFTYGANFEDAGIPFYTATGFLEEVDSRRGQSPWRRPQMIAPGILGEEAWMTLAPWLLETRSIPFMEYRPQRFKAVVQGNGVVPLDAWHQLLESNRPVVIPPHQQASVVFDQGEMTTAHPRLEFHGGAGARIKLIYAEAFSCGWRKGIRDQAEGNEIQGYFDTVISKGSVGFYEPFRWRAFRYIRMEVETDTEPLEIRRFSSMFSAYPFETKSSFECDSSLLMALWPICWRTQRLCTHETFMDCPYYEQLQYIGDTWLQAVQSYYVTGDSRPWKQALWHFEHSRLAEGLTQSRYPSHYFQVIPTFSLFYVMMVEDYLMNVGDKETVHTLTPTLQAILGWFTAQMESRGLLSRTRWWNFVDHDAWECGDPYKQTVDGDRGHFEPSTIVNLQLVLALQSLARMMRWLNKKKEASGYGQQARRLQEAVRRNCWDERQGLFADTPGGMEFSEHANSFAILTDTAVPARQKRIADQLAGDRPSIRCSMFFEFFLAMALAKVGRLSAMLKRLQKWQSILDLHLTTTPEIPPAPADTLEKCCRSDCHAWTAWPIYWMLAEILGIKPAAPAFKKIVIRPQLGTLQFARGAMPTPQGMISIHVAQDDKNWKIKAKTPAGIECRVVTPSGKKLNHHGGELKYEEHSTNNQDNADPFSTRM